MIRELKHKVKNVLHFFLDLFEGFPVSRKSIKPSPSKNIQILEQEQIIIFFFIGDIFLAIRIPDPDH
jgi:hypothetical protein